MARNAVTLTEERSVDPHRRERLGFGVADLRESSVALFPTASSSSVWVQP